MNIIKATVTVPKSELYAKSLREILEAHGLSISVERIQEIKTSKDDLIIKID